MEGIHEHYSFQVQNTGVIVIIEYLLTKVLVRALWSLKNVRFLQPSSKRRAFLRQQQGLPLCAVVLFCICEVTYHKVLASTHQKEGDSRNTHWQYWCMIRNPIPLTLHSPGNVRHFDPYTYTVSPGSSEYAKKSYHTATLYCCPITTHLSVLIAAVVHSIRISCLFALALICCTSPLHKILT